MVGTDTEVAEKTGAVGTAGPLADDALAAEADEAPAPSAESEDGSEEVDSACKDSAAESAEELELEAAEVLLPLRLVAA